MKILLAALITLSTACSVYAQHPTWLDEAIRVDDPDELAYWTAIDTDCPLTKEEVEGVVDRVLIGNRIKPLKDKIFEDGRIYLNLSVRCTRVAPDNKHAFSININFGRYKPWPAILFDAPYSAFGIGSADLIRQDCKERVEAAVAAFVNANALVVGRR